MKKKFVAKKFKNENEERKYWWNIDLGDYLEPDDLAPVRFPNLKPTTTPISIRIPNYLLSDLKVRANRLNIPYQALIKQAIAEKLEHNS